jgi:diaminopropionate ammonia-lyase
VKKKLEINENSNILIIGCEGDADEELYMNLLSKGSNQLSK